MNRFSDISNRIWKILAYVLAGLMLVLLAVVFWQILCRYVFKLSNGWTQEVSTLLFVWSTFLGIALAIRNGSQIAMTTLLKKMSGMKRNLVKLLSAVICEIVYLILTISCLSAMLTFFDVSSPALRMSMAIPYAGMMLSGFVMMFFGTDEILLSIRNIYT